MRGSENYARALPLVVASLAIPQGFGVLTLEISSNVTIAGIIDFDQTQRFSEGNIPARRDGLYNGFFGSAMLTGLLWRSGSMFAMELCGVDPGLGNSQSATARNAVVCLYIVFGAGLGVLSSVVMLFFPLKGKFAKQVRKAFTQVLQAIDFDLMRELETEPESPTSDELRRRSDSKRVSEGSRS